MVIVLKQTTVKSKNCQYFVGVSYLLVEALSFESHFERQKSWLSLLVYLEKSQYPLSIIWSCAKRRKY